MTEGTEWISGNFDSPLDERTATQLVEARGLGELRRVLHEFELPPLHPRRAGEEDGVDGQMINPHTPQHGEQKCTTCHKAHRASVNYCTQCHTDAVVPDGWLSYTDSKLLEEAAGITDEQ